MSIFDVRSAKIEANLARGQEITAKMAANIELAESLLSQLKASPWPWQRRGNARLRGQVRKIIARNRRLQAESSYLIVANSLLIAEKALERDIRE
jgi:hypothetical protein